MAEKLGIMQNLRKMIGQIAQKKPDNYAEIHKTPHNSPQNYAEFGAIIPSFAKEVRATDKVGKKTRDIAYHSGKNGGMVVVHSKAARAYSKYLEERPEITAYEACKPLDINRLDALQKTDIRGEYFREQWSSDFYIRHADGTAAVRELVSAADLTRRAEVEKLELSRRYWAALGVNNWKVVITGQ